MAPPQIIKPDILALVLAISKFCIKHQEVPFKCKTSIEESAKVFVICVLPPATRIARVINVDISSSVVIKT